MATDTTDIIKKYPFDPTGKLPDNKIIDEQHILTAKNNGDFQFIVPRLGPFFYDTFEVVYQEAGTGKEIKLVNEVDYYATHKFMAASKCCSLPIYGSITFLNRNIAGVVTITYQTIGGDWILDIRKIQEILGDRLNNPRVVSWDQVANYPAKFPALDHEIDLHNMVGMDAVTDGLHRIEYYLRTKSSDGLATHLKDTNNPHKVTAEQVGLGNVRNLPILPKNTNDSSDNYYVTPRGFKDLLNFTVIPTLTTHVNNTNNPHKVTAEQVGAYTKEDVNTILASYLPLTGTAINSHRLSNYNVEELKNYILDGTSSNSSALEGKSLDTILTTVKNLISSSKTVFGRSEEEFKTWVLSGKADDSSKFDGLTKDAFITHLSSLTWNASKINGETIDSFKNSFKDYLEENRLNAPLLNNKTADDIVQESLDKLKTTKIDANTIDGKTLDEIKHSLQAAASGDAGTLNGKTEEELCSFFMETKLDDAYVNTVKKEFNSNKWLGEGDVLEKICSISLDDLINNINRLSPNIIKLVNFQTPYIVENGLFKGKNADLNWDLNITFKEDISNKENIQDKILLSVKCNNGSYYDLVNNEVVVVKPDSGLNDIFYVKVRENNELNKTYLDIFIKQPPYHKTGLLISPSSSKILKISKDDTFISKNLSENGYKPINGITIEESAENLLLTNSKIKNDLITTSNKVEQLNNDLNKQSINISLNSSNINQLQDKFSDLNNFNKNAGGLYVTHSVKEYEYISSNLDKPLHLVPLITFNMPVENMHVKENFSEIELLIKGFTPPKSWGSVINGGNYDDSDIPLDLKLSLKRNPIDLATVEEWVKNIEKDETIYLNSCLEVYVTDCGEGTLFTINTNGEHYYTESVFDGSPFSDTFYFSLKIVKSNISNENSETDFYEVNVDMFLLQETSYRAGDVILLTSSKNTDLFRSNDYIGSLDESSGEIIIENTNSNRVNKRLSYIIPDECSYNERYKILEIFCNNENNISELRKKIKELTNENQTLSDSLSSQNTKFNDFEEKLNGLNTSKLDKTSHDNSIKLINESIDLVKTDLSSYKRGVNKTTSVDGTCNLATDRVFKITANGNDLNINFTNVPNDKVVFATLIITYDKPTIIDWDPKIKFNSGVVAEFTEGFTYIYNILLDDKTYYISSSGCYTN